MDTKRSSTPTINYYVMEMKKSLPCPNFNYCPIECIARQPSARQQQQQPIACRHRETIKRRIRVWWMAHWIEGLTVAILTIDNVIRKLMTLFYRIEDETHLYDWFALNQESLILMMCGVRYHQTEETFFYGVDVLERSYQTWNSQKKLTNGWAYSIALTNKWGFHITRSSN